MSGRRSLWPGSPLPQARRPCGSCDLDASPSRHVSQLSHPVTRSPVARSYPRCAPSAPAWNTEVVRPSDGPDQAPSERERRGMIAAHQGRFDGTNAARAPAGTI
jgi:hypothetical protein